MVSPPVECWSTWLDDTGLIPSGGSDYHGRFKPDVRLGVGRGDLVVPDEVAGRIAGSGLLAARTGSFPPIMKGKAMGMGAAALVVSGGVLASRVLGLGRETMLAALIGVNAVGDVYRAAFLVPDLLNYLLAGGYLTITFVPILAARLAANDPEGGNRAFVAVFRVVTGVTALLTAVLMIWTAPLIELIYPELSPAQLGEVTRLTMIALPAQVFFVGGSLLMAYQYAHRRFLIPVAAPIVYNLSIIVGGMVGGILVDPPPADGLCGGPWRARRSATSESSGGGRAGWVCGW